MIPTSVAPITFFVREEADWMIPRHSAGDEAETRGLSHGAQLVLEFLRQRGASFFADIVRGTGKLKAEIETGLWELVAAGLVMADGFDILRALIDPKRRSGQGSGRRTRPLHSSGRWALLHADVVVEKPRAVEAACWMLLRRYGIVIRDLLAQGRLPPGVVADGVPAAKIEEIRGGHSWMGSWVNSLLAGAVESVRGCGRCRWWGDDDGGGG